MRKFIGCKLVQATPCYAWKDFGDHKKGELGYKVVYPDGYVSWSPREVFERAYMEVGENNTVLESSVKEFIKSTHAFTVGDRTTVVVATLINGFKLVEASSCVDAKNYSLDYGTEICMQKIEDKIWYLLGFLLQSAKEGFDYKEVVELL